MPSTQGGGAALTSNVGTRFRTASDGPGTRYAELDMTAEIPLDFNLPATADAARTRADVNEATSGTPHQNDATLVMSTRSRSSATMDHAPRAANVSRPQPAIRTLNWAFRTNIPFIERKSRWPVNTRLRQGTRIGRLIHQVPPWGPASLRCWGSSFSQFLLRSRCTSS